LNYIGMPIGIDCVREAVGTALPVKFRINALRWLERLG
jgi:hypothetical protein